MRLFLLLCVVPVFVAGVQFGRSVGLLAGVWSPVHREVCRQEAFRVEIYGLGMGRQVRLACFFHKMCRFWQRRAPPKGRGCTGRGVPGALCGFGWWLVGQVCEGFRAVSVPVRGDGSVNIGVRRLRKAGAGARR